MKYLLSFLMLLQIYGCLSSSEEFVLTSEELSRTEGISIKRVSLNNKNWTNTVAIVTDDELKNVTEFKVQAANLRDVIIQSDRHGTWFKGFNSLPSETYNIKINTIPQPYDNFVQLLYESLEKSFDLSITKQNSNQGQSKISLALTV